MKWTDDKIDVLQNLEFSIVTVWRANRDMSNYTALRAYEAAFQFYRAELRGQSSKPPALKGLDATAYDSLKAMCEFRLGRAECPLPLAKLEAVPGIPLEKLLECLRQLTKSVERQTQLGGSQGYLTFIDRFLP